MCKPMNATESSAIIVSIPWGILLCKFAGNISRNQVVVTACRKYLCNSLHSTPRHRHTQEQTANIANMTRNLQVKLICNNLSIISSQCMPTLKRAH